MSATLEFLGGVGTVTGSKFLLDTAGHRTLLDCGLYQGAKELRLRNWEPLPVAVASINDVVLTHAHIDHAGYLPRLFLDGFRGAVHATHGTADLLPIMLADAGHLQEEEAEYHNLVGSSKHHPARPLYTASDGLRAATTTIGHGYFERFELAANLSVEFAPAGHIVGAASVTFEVSGMRGRLRLVCSGDVGRYGAPIMPDPTPIGAADYVMIESTYAPTSSAGFAQPSKRRVASSSSTATPGRRPRSPRRSTASWAGARASRPSAIASFWTDGLTVGHRRLGRGAEPPP